MQHYPANRARQGAKALVTSAQMMLRQAIASEGQNASMGLTGTSYYLPTTLALTGRPVETLSDLEETLRWARARLSAPTKARGSSPGASGARSAGLAALLAAETIEGLHSFANRRSKPGHHDQPPESCGQSAATSPALGPIDDLAARGWGIELADGRIAGIALIFDATGYGTPAAGVLREMLNRNMLCLLVGRPDGSGIVSQLKDAESESGQAPNAVLIGSRAASAVQALGLVTRCAMMLGGVKPGRTRDILRYAKQHVHGFVLCLGGIDDLTLAMAAAAGVFGFPLVTDTRFPGRRRADTRPPKVSSAPSRGADAADEPSQAGILVQECIRRGGIKVRTYDLDIPVHYGDAFEREVIPDAATQLRFGGSGGHGFELLQRAAVRDMTDAIIEVIGPDRPGTPTGTSADFGLIVRVAGRRMETDLEPWLESHIHGFINAASGVQHEGRRDAVAIRISEAAAKKGLGLRSLGSLLHARLRAEFPSFVEKAQVTIITDAHAHAAWLAKAREKYALRDRQLEELTDDRVQEFYSCSLCGAFAHDHACIVSPQRPGPCGTSSWQDCRASYKVRPTGAHGPIRLGRTIDAARGIWSGTNRYMQRASGGRVNEVSLYSIMHRPLTGCPSFECIVMLIPEANGVMVVSQQDNSVTPAGLNFSALARIAGAREQTAGLMGISRSHLLSPKFISAEGGLRRVVWMSSELKGALANELRGACERNGDPDLLARIADERRVTTVEALLPWMRSHNHPALTMSRMF